jgi:hypothetical protein
MITAASLKDFVHSLDEPVVQLDPPFRTMDLRILVKDAGNEPLDKWWQGKNMTPTLKKIVAGALLSTNPPEEIKNFIILLML